MADRILVLKDGTAAEYGPAGQVLAAPKSRYTRELLEAVPFPEVNVRTHSGAYFETTV